MNNLIHNDAESGRQGSTLNLFLSAYTKVL